MRWMFISIKIKKERLYLQEIKKRKERKKGGCTEPILKIILQIIYIVLYYKYRIKNPLLVSQEVVLHTMINSQKITREIV